MHVTVRMAWHDRRWDGNVCRNPTANTYCTGTHSLLSERLAREKRLDAELAAAGTKLDASLPGYLPPCFWSSCAFSESPTATLHRHPFGYLRDKKQIQTEIRPYSVYTWPFRLSITHDSFKRHGQYFPDLEKRINRYCARLIKGKSLIFFYLNYDNPVSADDYKYALVGCGRLSHDPELTGHFPFDKAELEEIRNGEGMKNFPSLNWAIQLTHQGAETSVRLPYQEYLDYIADHPEAESQLGGIKVLIEEPALLPGFKYVSEQVNDDHALALLYKLKHAFAAVQNHGIADGSREIETLDQYIEGLWASRGLYPGLGSVVSVLADLSEGEAQKENNAGQMLVDTIRQNQAPDDDLLDVTFGMLERAGAPPAHLAHHKNTVRDARAGLRDNRALLPALRKLSLFALTPRQIARILYPDGDGAHAFGGRRITAGDLVANPYLLSESYVPATDDDDESRADLDREQRTDGPIDYFTVDVGMFPDKRYLERNDKLQDLTVAGPERLRAFALEALNRNEGLGHSFALLEVLVEEAGSHPLFYKDKLALSERQFLSDEHLAHFRERMFVKEYDGRYFFYLQETKDAEDIIARFISERLVLPDLQVKTAWLLPYLNKEAVELDARISGFDAEAFKSERHQLMEDALKRRIYCITGRPGSGKTQALHALLDHLGQLGESAVVLAPTGKAALRLGGSAKVGTEWKAETIDHWIFRSGLGNHLGGHVSLNTLSRSERFQPTDNVVLDEMSMMDLGHLALLFRALEVHQPGSIKRVILVGDENQLPPIGCGRPFYDIISYLREDAAREKRNIVRLTTNCRQQHDPVVLDAAYLFAGKNRYHTDLYDRMLTGGKISPFLDVEYWETPEQLQSLVADCIDNVLEEAVPERDKLSAEQAFNLLMHLYANGFVPNNDTKSLALDRVQLLTPYRGGPSGSLGLSDFTRRRYRQEAWPDRTFKDTAFAHSDKVIRISNWYGWNPAEKRMELRLSNGSVGVLCNNKSGRKAFFPESEWPVNWKKMKEEDFELAYSVTVHKAQGSEFQEVVVVLPERRALLSRELVYTALTRSKTKLTLLIQKTPRLNPLQVARDCSVLLGRNSSIFVEPFDSRRIFEPEPGKKVKSKIEYLIYRELQQARDAGELTFEYEEGIELPIGGRIVPIRPDFTIRCGGKTFFWEHLGMLDRADYSRDWRERVAGYKAKNLADSLLTTDDLAGVRQERLKQVIVDLIAGKPSGDSRQEFSLHHYRL